MPGVCVCVRVRACVCVCVYECYACVCVCVCVCVCYACVCVLCMCACMCIMCRFIYVCVALCTWFIAMYIHMPTCFHVTTVLNQENNEPTKRIGQLSKLQELPVVVSSVNHNGVQQVCKYHIHCMMNVWYFCVSTACTKHT